MAQKRIPKRLLVPVALTLLLAIIAGPWAESTTYAASVTPAASINPPPHTRPGQTLAFSGQGPTTPGGCLVYWDQQFVGKTCSISESGDIKGTLLVPADATPGTHLLTACAPGCFDSSSPSEDASPSDDTSPSGIASPSDDASPSGDVGSVFEPRLALAAEVSSWRADAPVVVQVLIPEVRHLTVAAARKVLSENHLNAATPPDAADDATVISETPRAGNWADPDSPVTLAVQSVVIPPDSVVPQVVGLSVADARTQAQQHKLVLRTSAADSDVVTHQNLPAGAHVPPGSEMVVTAARAQVSVPSLLGLSRARAQAVLAQYGLTLRATGDRGVVLSQDPAAGSKVSANSVVSVRIGVLGTTTPPPTYATVPRLQGLTRAAAAAALTRVGLHLTAQGTGRVTSQRPVAGSRIPVGSFVAVALGTNRRPPVLVTVPDLRGKRLTDARSAVTAAGLVLSTSGQGTRVIAQDPPAGQIVPLGSTENVSLVVAERRISPLLALLVFPAAALIAACVLLLRRARAPRRRHESGSESPPAVQTSVGGLDFTDVTVSVRGAGTSPRVRLEPHVPSPSVTVEDAVPRQADDTARRRTPQ